MTLDEVMKIDNVSERTRAFSRLPEHEQRKLFNLVVTADITATWKDSE